MDDRDIVAVLAKTQFIMEAQGKTLERLENDYVQVQQAIHSFNAAFERVGVIENEVSGSGNARGIRGEILLLKEARDRAEKEIRDLEEWRQAQGEGAVERGRDRRLTVYALVLSALVGVGALVPQCAESRQSIKAGP